MTNYNKMSKKNDKVETEPVKPVETETTATEPIKPVETETTETTETAEAPKTTETEPIEGTVGCEKLYVRSDATVDSDPVGIIDRGSKVFIYEDESTEEFYKVCAATGLEGYCMKKFISVQ